MGHHGLVATGLGRERQQFVGLPAPPGLKSVRDTFGRDRRGVGERLGRRRLAHITHDPADQQDEHDEDVHDLGGRTVEVVVVTRDELADLVEEQTETDAAHDDCDDARRRT